jgi:hypothetical protein
LTAAIITLIVSLALNVLFAALLFRTHAQGLTLLDRAHERTTMYTSDLLDRLMAMDFNLYKAYTLQLEEPPGPELETEPEVPTLQFGPDRGGFGSKLGLRALTTRYAPEEAQRVRATEEMLESEIPG